MKVLANDGISQEGKKLLENAGIELIEHQVAQGHLANFINENQIDTLLVRSATQVTQELIDACPDLKIIGRAGVGMDNINISHAKKKNITLINTPNASSRSVAELVFAHIFSMSRHLHQSNREMPLQGETQFKELKKAFGNSFELNGKTLGIIGFGNIGKEVAKIGISLGMNIIFFTLNGKKETIQLSFFNGESIEFHLKPCKNIDEILKNSDFITIHTPKTESYILDSQEFEKMKDGVFLINTARASAVNEKKLLEFLDSGKIQGAALDVFENEPHPNISTLMNPYLSLSPHIGGSTIDAQRKIGIELAEKLIEINNKK